MQRAIADFFAHSIEPPFKNLGCRSAKNAKRVKRHAIQTLSLGHQLADLPNRGELLPLPVFFEFFADQLPFPV
jgi:hypothetical protein